MKINLGCNNKKYIIDKESYDDFSIDYVLSTKELNIVLSSKKKLENISISVELDYVFRDVKKIFTSGYQSWTDSLEHNLDEKDRHIKFPMNLVDKKYGFSAYGDYTFKNNKHKNLLHAVSYSYLRYDDSIEIIGSKNEKTGFTFIYFDVSRGKIIIEKDLEGLKLEKDETYNILDVLFVKDKYDKAFDTYFDRLSITRRPASPVNGYTSWYNYYQDISEEKVLGALESFESGKTDVFQIDDGYQVAVGDWLNIDKKKFPHGLKDTCQKIKNKQMTAGLWLAPFVCETVSDIYKYHKDWLVKDSNGRFVYCGSNWSGFYALDIYNSEVRNYLKKVFDNYKDMGFSLFKLDFLYAACIVPNNGKTRGEVMSDGMELLRQLVGDNAILACGVPIFSAFGMVEYSRIGPDVSLAFDDSFIMRFAHRERISTKYSILNTIYRHHLNNRAFLNDPDVFLLRDDIKMTRIQKENLYKANMLFGSVYFTSDDIASYDIKKKEFINENSNLIGSKILNIWDEGNYNFSIDYATKNNETITIRIDLLKR